MEPRKETQIFRTYVISTSLLIALLLSAVFFGINIRTRSLIVGELLSSAKAYFETIVATRQWNAQYGGVYVFKEEGVKSSPFLHQPDIHTNDGRTLTLKNHAIMTREISEIIGRHRDFAFHLTGIDRINPANVPDKFEKQALIHFETNHTPVHKIVTEGGHRYFRYMGPLVATSECRECHHSPHYLPGNVGGGISVSFRIDDVSHTLRTNLLLIILFGVMTTVLLVGTLWFLARRLMNRIMEARKALEQKNEELEQLDQIKNKFLGIAAHDMRNPLISIRGFSELLQGDTGAPLSDQQKDLIGIIYNESDAMLQLVNDLLDISAIESGKLDLSIEPRALKTLLEFKINTVKVIAKDKNIAIHTDLPEIPDALFDDDRIGQVIDNLVGNAIKFSPPDTNIYISLVRSGDMAEVSVRDEGPGIPPEDLPKIFGEFQKLSAKPTGGEKSTGLGLSIVNKIVTAHRGTIRVDSTPGEGATFTFSLPLADPAPSGEPAETSISDADQTWR